METFTGYRLIRSDRRTLSLSYRADTGLTVRAPRWLKKSEIDSFVSQKREWILKKQEQARAHEEKYPPPTEEEMKTLFTRAKAYLPARTEEFAARMGVRPASVQINHAKCRFGSCSSGGRIHYSCLLMRYPDEAIDYVIVHELAHLVHPDHSKAFYSYVGKYLPDYKIREKMLK